MAESPKKSRAPMGLPTGRILLAVLAAFLMVLCVRVGLAGQLEGRYVAPFAAFVALVLMVRVLLRALRFRGDVILLAAALFLAGLGLVAQLRLGTLDPGDPQKWSNYALPLGAMRARLLVFAMLMAARSFVSLTRLHGKQRH